MKNYRKLYTKHLFPINSEYHPQDSSFKAPSPFGDGEIVIDPKDQFHCHATGKKGGVLEFLKELYPGLTDQGANFMAREDNRIMSSRVLGAMDHLQNFRNNSAQVKIAADTLGLSESAVKSIPVYMNQRVSDLCYLETVSHTGVPLAISTFTIKNALRSLRGVPRIPVEITDRVWLVENSVMAHSIKAAYGDTAICWPKENEIGLYSYNELLKDKDVIILHGPLYYTYQQSYYPFLETIRNSISSFSRINYASICSTSLFSTWIERKENQDLLLDEAERGTMLQPVSREIYREYVRRDDTIPIAFAQSYARGFFFYGTACGKMVQSWPVDILSVPMLETNLRVSVITPEVMADSVHLTTDRVISITESLPQLTPKNTYASIKGLISDHIYLENKDVEVVIALWIMGTYLYSLFNAYPYLHIRASAGSGKTTNMEVIASTSFNGIMASKITPARLMQEVSDAKTTVCLDEFEKNSGSQGEANTEILNSGYKRNGSYLKMRGKNTNAMDLYSPKVFSSVSEIKRDTLASRTLPIAMGKKPKHHPSVKFNEDDHRTSQRINEVKNGGYALGLYQHYAIEYLMARLPKQISLPCGMTISGRNQELVTPLIVLAQLLDINRKEGEDSVEAQLYSALEYMLFPDIGEEVERLKILANQLREWGSDSEKVVFTCKGEKCWISNKMWDNSRLLTHFENDRTTMYNWLKGLNAGVERDVIHIPGEGTESCTGFPLDLTINGKPFIEWLMPKTASKAS